MKKSGLCFEPAATVISEETESQYGKLGELNVEELTGELTEAPAEDAHHHERSFQTRFCGKVMN